MASCTLPNDCWFEETRVPEQKVFDGIPFPLIVRPKPEFADKTSDQWETWVANNTNLLRDLLFKYEVVMFRDFPLETPAHFDRLVKAFKYEHFPYIGGAAPRKNIVGNVFTSNEAPLDQVIPFHHEMSQVRIQPQILFFYCDVAPKSGAQTSVVPSHVIYEDMKQREPAFVERLEREGVTYVRIMPEYDDTSSSNGRGWRTTFNGTSKEEAEKNAEWQGNVVEWLAGDLMKAVSTRPAVRVDPRTGRKTWFNLLLDVWLAWDDSRNQAKKSVYFPNGDPLPEGPMNTLKDVFEQHQVDIDYKRRDVMWVDNRQALHARQPGVGPRRVLAALCKDED